MGNTPSQTKNKEDTPSPPNLFENYSQNQNPSSNISLTTIRKKSDFLDSEMESYDDPQGVRTPIPNNFLTNSVDYAENLAGNIFEGNQVTFAQLLDNDRLWDEIGENIRRDWKPKRNPKRMLEDAIRQIFQAFQKYAHKIQFQRRNISEEDIDDEQDIYNEDQANLFFDCLMELFMGINRKGGLKSLSYKRVVMMLLNEHNPELNKKIRAKQGKVSKRIKDYLDICDLPNPKIKTVAKKNLRDRLVDLMSDEWIVHVVENEVTFKKNKIEELIFLQKYMRYFKQQLDSGRIEFRTRTQTVLGQYSEIEQKKLQRRYQLFSLGESSSNEDL